MIQVRRVGRFLAFLLLPFVLAAWPSRVGAQPPHQAALVVDFGDGRVVVRVVAFSGETISGLELLRQSGLDVAVMTALGGGAALCAVEGVGCAPTPQDCFCQCRGAPCRYWSYFHLRDGAWVYASVGAADRVLRDGDVDGWVWGDGRTPPPLLTWDQIWAAAQGPSPPPSATPVPLPSATAVPPSSAPSAPVALPVTATPASLPAPSPGKSPGFPLPSAGIQGPSPVPTAVAKSPLQQPSPWPTTSRPTGDTVPSPAGEESAEGEPPSPHGEEGRGEAAWTAPVTFAALVLLLLGLGLWVRLRR